MSISPDWENSKLDNLTSLIKDGSHGTHEDVNAGIPLLSAKDVRNGRLLIPENCRRILKADYQAIHRNYEISQGDILLTIVGSIGRCCTVTGLEPLFSIQRSVGVIRSSGIVPQYLYQYFQSYPFQANLQGLVNASAQGGVYLGSLSKCFSLLSAK